MARIPFASDPRAVRAYREALLLPHDRKALQAYVPVDRVRFPHAYQWWQTHTHGAYPRSPDHIERLLDRTVQWMSGNVEGFGPSPLHRDSLMGVRACANSLMRMFIVSEERDMSFDFVLAHALLEYHERHATDPRATDDPLVRSATYQFLHSGPHVDALRGEITFIAHDTYRHISFGRAELLALDNTRLLQDACRIFVHVELSCTPKENVRAGRLTAPRGVVIGPRTLAHIKYIDPFVMVVKFTTLMGVRDGDSLRDVGDMWRVVSGFAREKRVMLRGDRDAGEIEDVFDVRPLPSVSAGSYTREEFLTEDDEMPCALLVRKGDRWVGLVYGKYGPICDVLVNVDADFNHGALDELDARPTHNEFMAAFERHPFPTDLLEEVSAYGGTVDGRPVGVQHAPVEEVVEARKRKQ